MDSLPVCTTTTATFNSFPLEFWSTFFLNYRRFSYVKFPKKPRKVSVFASKDEPPPPPPLKLDELDRMELKFGKLLGEDPKLTLAKIRARKIDPDVSYLEVEKYFAKNKGKFLYSDLEEVELDVSEGKKQADPLSQMNLVRPVPKQGVKFETKEKSVERCDKKPSQINAGDNTPSSMPNVILRKPSVFNEAEDEKSLPISVKPKLSWKMAKEQQKERNSDLTLLERPKPLKIDSNPDGENDHSVSRNAEALEGTGDDKVSRNSVSDLTMNNATLLKKPEPSILNFSGRGRDTSSGNNSSSSEVDVVAANSLNPASSSAEMRNMEKHDFNQSLDSTKGDALAEREPNTGLQPSNLGSPGKSAASKAPMPTELRESNYKTSADAGLLGKPKRPDQSVKAPGNVLREEPIPADHQSQGSSFEDDNLLTSPKEEHEENDWRRAEDLAKSGGRAEVEVISSSTRGFAVSFGSLIGFLPYRNVAAKWRFLAFESWLRRKGLVPSKYKQNLGVIGSFETALKMPSFESMLDSKVDDKFEGDISPDMKLEDLYRIYDQEKTKFLSSFVGQKIKVAIVLVERRSRRLIFSTKPNEKEELVEKRKNLMGKLNVGDVVKCCIKKITYFGVFVEVEGVPALIHQSEVSWDATLDPESYFKVGQVIDAKVHQLDFSLERIFLSLKDVMPDPLAEALDAVIGDHNSLNGRLEVAQPEEEWNDVESLIKELQQVEGIQSVSKGRYFSSPGLAPTFQVYMASMSENQYKLLARSGNKAQEVMVESTLPKEEMKSTILTCTNRVE